jgi:peptide/nickel transport system substrate-binding protein
MFDALTFIQSDGKLRPSLALSWAQLDPLTWQFRLRVDDARFHNGELFGPESVRLTFDRLRGSKLTPAKLASGVERVDIVNPATVNLVTRAPDASLPRWISVIYMLPPRYFAQAGEAGFLAQPFGTGYWQLDEFQPDKHLHLTQFRESWRSARGGDSAPPLKRLEFELLPQSSARLQVLTALQVDVATELSQDDGTVVKADGFAVHTTGLRSVQEQDQSWQQAAFGSLLGPATDIYAAAANVKGVTVLPSGAWWFDRVTKTAMQRIAVAGGA